MIEPAYLWPTDLPPPSSGGRLKELNGAGGGAFSVSWGLLVGFEMRKGRHVPVSPLTPPLPAAPPHAPFDPPAP